MVGFGQKLEFEIDLKKINKVHEGDGKAILKGKSLKVILPFFKFLEKLPNVSVTKL